MKKTSVFFLFNSFLTFSSILFFACQDNLIDSPTFQTKGSYSTGKVLPPEDLSATQGGCKNITLTWKASKSAVKYEIYSSETSTGEFTKRGETTDSNCTYIDSDFSSSDSKRYYKVLSVDQNEEKSEQFSNTCFGTTLACPIITSVKQSPNGDSITVKWYKGVNCTTETYLNENLIYRVILYNSTETEIVKEETISALDVIKPSETECTFTGLSANTNYKVRIEAYTKAFQDSKMTETSDALETSTAHSLIPSSPESFSVSKGTSDKFITISWVLPKFTEIKKSEAYESRPVYFKVFRKLESESDSSYEAFITYLGTTELKSSETPESNALYFTKSTNSETGLPEASILYGSSVKDNFTLSVEYPSESTETNLNYPNYIPGTKVILKDYAVQRGKKYSYRIQSFTDDTTKKNTTSDESLCDGEGHLINSAIISVKTEYTKENENIKDFTVTLNFTFDDFGENYNYVITQNCQTIKKNEDGTTEQIGENETKNFNSKTYSSFFPKVFTYTPPEDEDQYYIYSYSVSVCPETSNSSDISKAYFTKEAPGSVIVIKDSSMIPSVEDFSIEDGYKDHFNLSWTYDKNCQYKLTWKNIDKDENEEECSYNLTEEDLKDAADKELFTFSHSAQSGDIRSQYTLTADNGFTSNVTLEGEYKTLGTAEPYFNAGYTTIKVLWPKVQKAESYSAKYIFNGTEKPIDSELIKEEGENYYCEITKPYGETESEGTTEETLEGTAEGTSIDNATDACISGKDIQFILTATSKKDEAELDTTTAEISISTLGPANTNIDISGDRENIYVEWNKVPGATGYLIFRKKYIEYYFTDQNDKGDIYYFEPSNDNSENKFSLIGSDNEPSATCQAITSTKVIYRFTDKYQKISGDNEENYKDPYKINQAQLSWGLPYGYTIIPVKKSDDFEFNDNLEIVAKDSSSSVEYSQASLLKIENKCSTFGYGLDITASKAETNDKVNILWKSPYKSSTPTLLYRSYNAENGSEWTQAEDYNGNASDTSLAIKPQTSYKAYDYMIYYNLENGIEIDPYYEKFISERTDSDGEKQNKGYIFSFMPPSAMHAEGYSEKFIWQTFGSGSFSIYDSNERKKIPDEINICMLNTNKAYGWKTIATINPATLKAEINSEDAKNNYDLNVETSTGSITVSPYSITNNNATNTDGLLKVLRDAKHYYKLTGKRTSGETEVYTESGSDGSIFAYREITDEELVKAAMLTVSYAFYLEGGGKEDLSNVSSILKYEGGVTLSSSTSSNISGKATFGSRSYIAWGSEIGKYKADVTFNDFSAKMLNPYGTYTAFTKVSMSDVSTRTQGLYDSYLDKFKTTDFEINVANADSSIPLDYSATLKVTCESNSSLKITKRDTTLVDTTDADTRKKWFPIQISDTSYHFKSTDYGWWETN